MKRNIVRLGCVLLGGFLALAVHLGYLQAVQGRSLTAHPYNRRLAAYEQEVLRGSIVDRQGRVLARTERPGRRIYPDGYNVAPVVGYLSPRYGRTGLEAGMDYYLLGLNPELKLQNMVRRLKGEVQRGNTVKLTLDAELQAYAMRLLSGRRGAAVLLDPRTGEVLALASQPSFDPGTVDDRWADLSTDPAAPLVNRAVDGAYPPGSIMKLITAAAALAAGKVVPGEVFSCPGYITVDGFTLRDTAAHGKVNLVRALALSCNTTFAHLGLRVGAADLVRTAQAFGFDRGSGFELPERGATMAAPEEMTRAELAASSIGQGRVLVSPLRMALVAAAIANQGVIMQPHLVAAVEDPEGRAVLVSSPRVWLTATTPQTASVIREGMVAAVREGTAREAALSGVTVAGKTGSAETTHGPPHAWFVGFAPAEAPRVVVAVIVENAGAGGAVAAPLGRQLLKKALARDGLEEHGR